MQLKGLAPNPALCAAASSAAPAASRKAVRSVFVCSHSAVLVFAPLLLLSRFCSTVVVFCSLFSFNHFGACFYFIWGNMIYKYTLYELDIFGFLE